MMNKSVNIDIKFSTAFWVLIIGIIAIILGFRYKKQLGAIFSRVTSMVSDYK